LDIQSLKLAFFSPTGTTKSIVSAVARGLDCPRVSHFDITRPSARAQALHASKNELLVVGVPVYMGRVPALLSRWLRSIDARGTPAVCIVVYGNREFDDALLELKDALSARGCTPIAGAAFIGEHSFSTHELPIADHRPDEGDLRQAEIFGRRIRELLSAIPSIDGQMDLRVPGVLPYRAATEIWNVDFIEVGEDCVQCGACAESCPMGAIDPASSRQIDVVKCITCCACIKGCPQGARAMKAGTVLDVATRLNRLCAARKEPQLFLA